MLSLAGRYDTAVLVSGDEDFVYAVNAVAYKGCRVEVAGFRSNTAPRLIDVADFFIDLGGIAELIRKDRSQRGEYEVPSFVLPHDLPADVNAHRNEHGSRPNRAGPTRTAVSDQHKGPRDLVRVNDDQ